jgi:hypothetical protein
VGALNTKGQADLIEEHRGHKQVVPGIRDLPTVANPKSELDVYGLK